MKLRKDFLPVLKPQGGKEEIKAVTEVINSGCWGKGPKVEKFEEEFAKMVKHKYAIAVTSNSHGQDLVMKAMGFKGVDVINPTISSKPFLQSGNDPTPGKTKWSALEINSSSLVTWIVKFNLLVLTEFLNAFSTDLKLPEP